MRQPHTAADPIVRLIQRSPISDERKTELLGEWHQRLEREQQLMAPDPATAAQLAALSKRRRRLPVPVGLGLLLVMALPILVIAVWASLAGVL